MCNNALVHGISYLCQIFTLCSVVGLMPLKFLMKLRDGQSAAAESYMKKKS